jgi:hypothetical protein
MMGKNQSVCTEVLRFICDNLDEDLDSPSCTEIKSHLEICTHCAGYLKSMKKTVELYKTYPTPDISEGARKSLDELISRLKF